MFVLGFLHFPRLDKLLDGSFSLFWLGLALARLGFLIFFEFDDFSLGLSYQTESVLLLQELESQERVLTCLDLVEVGQMPGVSQAVEVLNGTEDAVHL